MIRDIVRLSEKEYDILIAGGGIYGATLAREAASRGLNVAVVDRADFCAATSANSLKIIHGGVRYLQQFDIPRLRQSVRERRMFLRIAPHLVHPLSCAMPTWGRMMKSRGVMRLGLLANDILSMDRNCGVARDKAIPPGRVGSRSEWLNIAHGLDDPRYTGVALWNDAYAYNTERLGLGFVQDAVRAGADAANYVKVSGFTRNGRDVTGVTAIDVLQGKKFSIRARLTVINTGPWTKQTLGLLGDDVVCPVNRVALAMNLVFRRQLIRDHAVGLMTREKGWKSGRLFFFMPWREQTVAGTYLRPHDGDPDLMKVTKEDVSAFLSSLNRAFPGACLQNEDITMIHSGLLPAENLATALGEEPVLLNRFRIIDHAESDGIGGLFTVLGVKYTTARDVAQKTVDMAIIKLGSRMERDQPASQPLPGGDFADLSRLAQEAEQAGLSRDIARQLVFNYGTCYADVIGLAGNDRCLLTPVSPACRTIGAEVVHAVRNEMAQNLSDIIMRRTELGSAGLPDDTGLRNVATLAARELRWDNARIEDEIERVKSLPAWH